jgi:hypothetical protein
MTLARTGKSEDGRTYKCKSEANPVCPGAVRVHSNHNGYRGAKGGDLRKSEVHEDDTSLDNMDPKVGVNARQNQACHKGSEQEMKHIHQKVSYLVVSNACLSFAMS